LELIPGGIYECWSRDGDDIPTWRDLWEQYTKGFPQAPLSPVPLYRVTDRFAGGYSEPRMVKLVFADDEKNKRVGKGLTRVPHPFEVGRIGEPVSTVHPPGQLSAGNLQPKPP
jgi:hypothetical protein